MISDTLSSTATEIRIYLFRYPQAYVEGTRQRLEKLVDEMDSIRRTLDMAPGLQALTNPVNPDLGEAEPALLMPMPEK